MRKIILITTCSLCIAGFIGILFGFQIVRQPVSAQEPILKTSILTEHSETVTDKNTDRLERFNALIQKAQTFGSVKVIVGLPVDFTPEGNLSSSSKKNQRTEIKRAQGGLLDELRNFTVEDVKKFDFIPYVAFKIDAATLEQLKKMPKIVSIQEDKLVAPTLAESTVVVGSPGGVSNGFSGAGQAVAVLDTGVYKNHVFFSGGKVISEACYSTNNNTDGATSVCPNGATSSTATDSGLNCSDFVSGCFHGTYVAGIVAGRDTAGNRFGVAKDAKIIAIQVFSSVSNASLCGFNGQCALSYTSDIISGLQRVSALNGTIPGVNIAAVNLSLGGDKFETNCDNDPDVVATKAAIDNLRSVGIATVIATGNNGYTSAVNFPGCISTAISVGSTTDGTGGGSVDVVAGSSNSADFINLLAPGVSITSSVPGAPGNNFSTFSGTSAATPHVAGAWAILKQQNPAATVSQILTALTSTGKIITDGRSDTLNRKTPRIRIDAASHQLTVPVAANCERAPININQTISTSLDTGDCSLESGVNRDLYAFTAGAGAKVTITMSSAVFDTYLYLLDPNGKIIASDDNSGGGTDARIPLSGALTLPLTGSYTIIATKSGTFRQAESPQNGNYVLNIGSPTAAFAIISGRVILPDDLALKNALVTLTDSLGNARTVSTVKGRFRFIDVAVGETYILSVLTKRYTFIPQVISVTEDITDLNFNAVQ